MLAQWGALTDPSSGSSTKGKRVVGESNEAREGRLRIAYENALEMCNTGKLGEAKEALLKISKELTIDGLKSDVQKRTSTQNTARSLKRPRVNNESPWVRSLRYAVNRNLASVYMTNGNPFDALRNYALALEDDNSDFIVWMRAARSACAIGHLHVARRAYESALHIRPGHWLCQEGYRAVLNAIGDQDEDADVNTMLVRDQVDQTTIDILKNRYSRLEKEMLKRQERDSLIQELKVGESRWMCLIDAVGANLACRLGRGKESNSVSVGSPISVILEGLDDIRMDVAPVKTPVDCSDSASDKELCGSISESQLKKQDAKCIDDPSPDLAQSKIADEEKTVKKHPVAPPPCDPRRSLRQRGMEEPIIQQPEEVNDEFLSSMLSLAQMASDTNFEYASEELRLPKRAIGASVKPGTAVTDEPVASEAQEAMNRWGRLISEGEELQEVALFCNEINKENSGSFDVMMRILFLLAEKETTQFISELAQAWILLRKYGSVDVPGSIRMTICVIEALLVSGAKVKKTKVKKYNEAARLLSIVSAMYCEYYNENPAHGAVNKADDLMLRLRCAWLYCQINEKNGVLGEAFEHASRALQLSRSIALCGASVMARISGPELTGMECSAVICIMEACVKRLKRSSELQKATKELESTKEDDLTSASKALAILAPSIRESVQLLGLNQWKKGEAEAIALSKLDALKTRAEQSPIVSEGEELEKRLRVFGEACMKSKDSVGEVLCTSIRLRLAVISYWVLIGKERADSTRRRSHIDAENSSACKLSETLTEIRHYVMIVKVMTASMTPASSSPTLETSGWSLADVVQITIHTLISLSELLCKMIPTVENSPTNSTQLTGQQKNQRLAFTRCILAFCRCIELRMKLIGNLVESEQVLQRLHHLPAVRMLTVISFCLSVLTDRGCCRGEGTAGALLRMYTSFLAKRLQFLMMRKKETQSFKKQNAKNRMSEVSDVIDLSEDVGMHLVTKKHSMFSLSYSWEDISIVRQQLAQCYYCVYRLSDLETAKHNKGEAELLQWLEYGCNASKQSGLTFVTGDPVPSTPKMTADICRNVFFLYRKQLLMHSAYYPRDRARVKATREIIQEIVATLPDDPPEGVPALTFAKLDTVVSSAVEDKAPRNQAFSKWVVQMRKDWESTKADQIQKGLGALNDAERLQVSTMYFESHILDVIRHLAAYESEFKKTRNVSRRKSPKEGVERLFNASTDCVTALRCRPWSIGAWILLGRIFVELADVALDEREMALSTFGVFQPQDLASGDGGESAEGINLRAEVCFGFAEVLIDDAWSRDECSYKPDIPAAEVYSEAREDDTDMDWCGYGDDGDLFGGYGLCNKTTSRPWLADEDHPHKELQPENSRLKAAVHFGRSALLALRSQEDRYWYSHWNYSVVNQSDLTKKVRPLSSLVAENLRVELENLEKGMQLVFLENASIEQSADESLSTGIATLSNDAASRSSWRKDLAIFEKQKWYYLLRRAKLKRKLGSPPIDYVCDFASALTENIKLRTANKLPPDIEPFYQLHVGRAKLLLDVNSGFDPDVLLVLIQHSFSSILLEQQNQVYGGAQNVELARRLIADDILNAMKSCGRGEQSFSEFYFKSTFYRAVLYRDFFDNRVKALEEISQLFRGESAAKVIESNSDGVHRGYFYLFWNYRHTDTGCELTLEPERKLVRWRFKMLSLYLRLLRESGDRKTIAGIVSRLKRRAPDDLPVDGAMLDDMVLCYSEITRHEILSKPPVSQIGSILSLQDCELSFRQTWDVFVETLRLVQGVRRLRSFVERDDPAGIHPQRLIESKRPWCQVAIANTLHLERLRWLAVSAKVDFDVTSASSLPFEGSPEECDSAALGRYADTMEHCGERWKIEAKLDKLLKRRIEKYRKMQACVGSPIAMRKVISGNESSGPNTPARP